MIKLNKQELRRGKSGRHEYGGVVKTPIFLICDELNSSFNMGVLFRLSAALLIEKIITCGRMPRLDNFKFKKTARGSSGWIDHEHHEDILSLIMGLRERGMMIASVELAHGSINYSEAVYRFPLAFVLGNETDGVNEEVLQQSDIIVSLPMPGMINSLNVSTAASVVLYDAYGKYLKNK